MHNHVILTGRITANPELRQTPSGVLVCRFDLAVQRKKIKNTQERETDFIDIEAWRGTAEFISKYFRKGDLTDISGRLKTSRWKDEKGVTHYQTSVVAENVEFAPTNNRKTEKKQDKYRDRGDDIDIADPDEVIDEDDDDFSK